MRTLEDQLEATKGRSSGFDYMRLILAILIVAFHSIVTTYGLSAHETMLRSWQGAFIVQMLPMFFVLSGFLVAGSLERCRSLISFLALRALRIFPALGVEVVLSALLMGPVFTSLTLTEYFSSPIFSSYILNIIGDVHYNLPGVFERNPISVVNAQLWTVPTELECYILLSALSLLTLTKRRNLLLFTYVLFIVAYGIRGVQRTDISLLPARVLIEHFMSGVVFYLYRDRVPFDGRLAAVAFGLALIPPLVEPRAIYFSSPAIAYLTVYLGLLNPRKISFLQRGDFSYGLFLYGFPIQQALMATLPGGREWWINIAIALPLALGFAMFSWHVVEKRMLRLRTPLCRWEASLLLHWSRLRPNRLKRSHVPVYET